jgi:hypothetical protein
MNQPMNHRHEAVLQSDGSWTVNELVDGSVVHQLAGVSKRDALQQAVRLNRSILRDEQDERSGGVH